jgi:hypothetical protein
MEFPSDVAPVLVERIIRYFACRGYHHPGEA